MLTPAEELLAAVKDHATADVRFEYDGFNLHTRGRTYCCVYAIIGGWAEEIGSGLTASRVSHKSASSAVQSAFARARGKQP